MRKNNIEPQYLDLLKKVLASGTRKDDRTGTGTISLFGKQIRHDMSLGFPALTTKKFAFKTMATELTWFLRGDTNIKYLVDRNCHVWDGDCYQAYCKAHANNKNILSQKDFIAKIKNDKEFSNKFGNLGRIYGAQWRDWRGIKIDKDGVLTIQYVDQIKELIKKLKANPDSRRLLVNAWNPIDVKDDTTVLPPCHYGFQLYTRLLSYQERYDIWFKQNYETGLEYNPSLEPDFDHEMFEPTPIRSISLMYNARSQDLALGTPFNIASYALLLKIIAKEVNMIPSELVANMGDCHVYKNHIEGVKEQLQREPLNLPQLKIKNNVKYESGDVLPFYETNDFSLVNYKSHPKIRFQLSN